MRFRCCEPNRSNREGEIIVCSPFTFSFWVFPDGLELLSSLSVDGSAEVEIPLSIEFGSHHENVILRGTGLWHLGGHQTLFTATHDFERLTMPPPSGPPSGPGPSTPRKRRPEFPGPSGIKRPREAEAEDSYEEVDCKHPVSELFRSFL